MSLLRLLFCGFWCLCAATVSAFGSATGLNTIPTTDLVPARSWIGQIQNGNTNFGSPSLFANPDLLVQSQFSLGNRMEFGVDYTEPTDFAGKEYVLNVKGVLLNEDDLRPNMALGVENIANHALPTYYLTFSKTLNYEQEQRERFRAHHRRNRKVLGHRVHLGLMLVGRGALQPFVGTDLQLNDSTVFQADWISGSGNAVTIGLAYVLKDQRTVLNPALLYSNDTSRVGFFLNISHQFNL